MDGGAWWAAVHGVTKSRTRLSDFFDSLLLLFSRSNVVSNAFATPWTVVHQAPPSMGFSRQDYWSGLPFPSPMRESEVCQSCPTFSDPMGCSLPGSSVYGIFQAKVLEWGAIAFCRGSSQPRDQTYGSCHISCITGRFFTAETPG